MPKYVILIILFLTSKVCIGQEKNESEQILPFELELGLGYVKSSETNLFNNGYPFKPGGALGFILGVRGYINYHLSIGLHLKGFIDIINNYDTNTTMGFPNDTPLSIANLDLGFNVRYTWGEKRWQPYVFSGLGMILGSLTGLEETINEYYGVAISFGAGLGYMVTREVMISGTITRSLGTARWTYPPSYDAFSSNFNPGLFAAIINISYFFHSSGS